MALTLNDTPKAAAANTYASLVTANTYHESHVDSSGTWAGASDPEKNISLVMGTRILNVKFEWAGVATDPDQVLPWPRAGLLDFIRRNSLDEDTYPTQLEDATSELARLLLGADTTKDLIQSVQGLTGLTVGPIALSFKEYIADSKPIPDSVRDLIPYWWGRLRSAGFTRPIVRA